MSKRTLSMDVNGDVRPSRAIGAQPRPGTRMLLLVHGYNNNPAEARESYFHLRKNLDDILRECGLAEGVRQAFQAQIWELYWPGFLPITYVSSYGQTRGLEIVPSALSYSQEVRKAGDWVPRGLAEFLKSISPSEIFFIGHSLGCRVVLETISWLLAPQKIVLSGFILMAGAVPIHMLVPTEKLRRAATVARKRYCLYSWIDLVLSVPFGPGQILAGEPSPYLLPIATGLTGAPKGFYDARCSTWLGHGGYWKRGVFEGPGPYADMLAGSFPITLNRKITETGIIQVRDTRKSRAVPSRTLPSRAVPGNNWLGEAYGPDSRS